MNLHKIYIADDNLFLVNILAESISKNENIKIVGTSTGIDHLLDSLKHTQVDLLILDVNFGGVSSLDYISKMREIQPTICIVNLTTLNNSFVKNEAINAGVDEFLGKDECHENFAEKLITILQKTEIDKQTVKKHQINNEVFTQRQLNILTALYNCNTEKEAAENLHISLPTLKTHKQHLFLKTNSKNNLELIKFGIKEGLLIV